MPLNETEIEYLKHAQRELVNMGGGFIKGVTYEGRNYNLIDSAYIFDTILGVPTEDIYGCVVVSDLDGLSMAYQYNSAANDELEDFLTDGFKSVFGLIKDEPFNAELWDNGANGTSLAIEVDVNNNVTLTAKSGALDNDYAFSAPFDPNHELLTQKILTFDCDMPSGTADFGFRLYYARHSITGDLVYLEGSADAFNASAWDGARTLEVGANTGFKQAVVSLQAFSCATAETYDAAKLFQVINGLVTSNIKGETNNFEASLSAYTPIVSFGQFLGNTSLSMNAFGYDTHKMQGRDAQQEIPPIYLGVNGAKAFRVNNGDRQLVGHVRVPTVNTSGSLILSCVVQGKPLSNNGYLCRFNFDNGDQFRVNHTQSDDRLTVYYNNTDGTTSKYITPEPWTPDTWFTLIAEAAADGSTVALFINGVRQTLTDVNQNATNMSGDQTVVVNMGSNSNGATQWKEEIGAGALFLSDSPLSDADALAIHDSTIEAYVPPVAQSAQPPWLNPVRINQPT